MKALITFAKAPVPGTVKTRLQAGIGAEKAVEIYTSFVVEILSKFSWLKDIDRFLGCAPDKSHPFLKGMARTYGLTMFKQQGDTLGSRIFNAFRYCAKKGYSEIVLIGTDSPSIPVDIIKKAFKELKKNDLVIGPCTDQGFYLIGVRKDKISEISRNVQIDTGEDVNNILGTINSLNLRLSLLPFWYDVDDVNDLKLLRLHLDYLGNNFLP